MPEHDPGEEPQEDMEELPPFTMDELKILLKHQRDTAMDYKRQFNTASDSEQRLRAELAEAKMSQETSDLKATRALNLTKIFQGKCNLAEEENSNLRKTLDNHSSQSERTIDSLRQELLSATILNDSDKLTALKQLTQSKKETTAEANHCRRLDRRAERAEEENTLLRSTIDDMKAKHSEDHRSWQAALDNRPSRQQTTDASTCVRNVFGPTNKTSWGDLYEDDDH